MSDDRATTAPKTTTASPGGQPASTITLPIEAPFESIDDVIKSCALLEEIFFLRHDRRAIFVTAYLTISRAIKGRIADGFFQANDWVGQYLLAFANHLGSR